MAALAVGLGVAAHVIYALRAPRATSIPDYVDPSALRAINETPFQSVEWGFLSGEVFGQVAREGVNYRLKFIDESGKPVAGIPLTERHEKSRPKIIDGRLAFLSNNTANEAYSRHLGTTAPDGTLSFTFALLIRCSGLSARTGFGWMQFVALFNRIPCQGLDHQAFELPAPYVAVLPDGTTARRFAHFFALLEGTVVSGLFLPESDVFIRPFDGTIVIRRSSGPSLQSVSGPVINHP